MPAATGVYPVCALNPYQPPDTTRVLTEGEFRTASAVLDTRFRVRLIPVVLLWSLAAILFAAFASLLAPVLLQIVDEGWQPPNPESAFSLASLTGMGCCLFVAGFASIAGRRWLRAQWMLAVLWTIATILFGNGSIFAIAFVTISELGRT